MSEMPDPRRIARRWLAVAGGVLSCAGMLALHASSLFAPPGPFDEGLLATNSFAVSQGRMPYHDFLCMYGFAEWYVNAGALRVFGHSLTVIRVMRLLAHAGMVFAAAMLSMCLVRRADRKLGIGQIVAGVGTGILVLTLFGSPCTWALLVCLLAVHSLHAALESCRPATFAWCGLWLGAAAWFRIDMAATAMVGFLGAMLAWWYISDRSQVTTGGIFRNMSRTVGVFGLTVAVGYAAFIICGPFDVWFGLVELPQRAMAGRMLPFPGWRASGLTVYSLHMVLLGTGWLLALYRMATARQRPSDQAGMNQEARTDAGATSAVAMGLCLSGTVCLVYALSRCDRLHQVPALLYAYALMPYMLSQLWRLPRHWIGRPAAAALTWVTLSSASMLDRTPAGNLADYLREGVGQSATAWTAARSDVPSYGIAQPDPRNGQLEAVRFVRNHTTAAEALYVGLVRHDRVYLNDIMFYFLCERLPAVRDHHFDPTTTTASDFQRRMVNNLVTSKPTYVVLWSGGGYQPEADAPTIARGASLLDDYLSQHFVMRRQFGEYTLLQRR